MKFESYETILIRRVNSALIVSLNRPKKNNALSKQIFLELWDLFSNLSENPGEIRGVCLIGEGDKAFAAGADILAMHEMTPAQGEEFCALAQSVTRQMELLPIPVIACVNGYAFGGGCELAMSCDFIFATRNAQFGQPEVNLGLIPGFGGCVRLSRYVGLALARELIFTGRRVNIEEATRIGLVNRAFDSRDQMLAAALETIELIAEKSKKAVALCKSTIMKAETQSIEVGLVTERNSFRIAFEGADKIEGVGAFLEKRKAQF